MSRAASPASIRRWCATTCRAASTSTSAPTARHSARRAAWISRCRASAANCAASRPPVADASRNPPAARTGCSTRWTCASAAHACSWMAAMRSRATCDSPSMPTTSASSMSARAAPHLRARAATAGTDEAPLLLFKARGTNFEWQDYRVDAIDADVDVDLKDAGRAAGKIDLAGVTIGTRTVRTAALEVSGTGKAQRVSLSIRCRAAARDAGRGRRHGQRPVAGLHPEPDHQRRRCARTAPEAAGARGTLYRPGGARRPVHGRRRGQRLHQRATPSRWPLERRVLGAENAAERLHRRAHPQHGLRKARSTWAASSRGPRPACRPIAEWRAGQRPGGAYPEQRQPGTPAAGVGQHPGHRHYHRLLGAGGTGCRRLQRHQGQAHRRAQYH